MHAHILSSAEGLVGAIGKASAVPRYFFDVHDSADVVDDVGMELADTTAARDYARQLAAKYASEPANYDVGGTIVVVTRDGPSSVVSTVRMVFQEVVAQPARPDKFAA